MRRRASGSGLRGGKSHFGDKREAGIHRRFPEMPPPDQEKYMGELEKIYFAGGLLRLIGMSPEERDLDAKRKDEQKSALDKKYGLLEEA